MKVLPEPWIQVSPDQQHKLEAELARELPDHHMLAGKRVHAIARRSDNDDVLFEVEDVGFAVVHLTWRGAREPSSNWPSTEVFPSLDEWSARQEQPLRVLFLDVDGVLNRTGFRPDEVVGLRSWIEAELAQRLSEVLRETGAEIVMSSDWRCGRELQHLRDELHAAGIAAPLLGVTPTLTGQPRWREIEAWMSEHGVEPESVVIVDDGFDMGALAARFVRANPLNGLDEAVADAIVKAFNVPPFDSARASRGPRSG